jgi:hypothetical protein
MNTSRVRLLCFTVVLLALSAFPAFASSASGVRIVRLSLAQGDVQIDRNSGDGWEQAINNMPVIGGARVYAAQNSKAELEFEDGSSVRLVGPAQITLTQLSTAQNGSPVNVIQVDSGQVYINARLHHHDQFRVLGPTGESFEITQPSHLRFTVDQQTASLAVMDGEAVVQANDRNANAKVRGGETYNYVLGQPESAARLNSVPPQPEDTWDQQRDTYNDQNASAGAQYSGSDDSNAYGNADLGYYGSYSDIPGYGMAWQPYGVGPDWNPYGYGAWSYYPSFGWTFVSGYPWGWAPFFYGNWCFVNGRGWWWRPGPWHGPWHGGGNGFNGGSGFHPQPRFAGHPAGDWNAPHPPARVAQGTVAVAGSNLRVGPIGDTHATMAGSGFVSGTRNGNSMARVGPTSNLVHGSAALNPGLNRGNSYVTGQRGSYVLNGPSTGRNGSEVHRPPASYGAPPHSYSYVGGSAPRAFTGPPASMPRMPSAPSVSSAPHVSSAPSVSSGVGGGFSHGGGGGFSGGGGFHGGGGGHR